MVQRPSAPHTRPELAPPQSESTVQPQTRSGRQAEPSRSFEQFCFSVGVHSTHSCGVASQTMPGPQSAVARHCTHWCGLAAVSQRLKGTLQSESETQPWTQCPTLPSVALQFWPVGQPLRPGAVEQPGRHWPAGPEQINPEVELPQSGSLEQPHRPRLVTHAGSGKMHSALLVDEHSLQVPVRIPPVWQTGKAGSAHCGAPSAVQGVHWCWVGSQ